MIDKTKDEEGIGYQILSARNPENNKKDNLRKDNRKFTRKESAVVAVGFIFRTFIIILLFLYGLRMIIVVNEITASSERLFITLLLRLAGVGFVFLSQYLLFNSFMGKINQGIYIKWCLGFIFALVVLFCTIVGGGSSNLFFDILSLAFRG